MRRCLVRRRARAAFNIVLIPVALVVLATGAGAQTARPVVKEILPSVLTLEIYGADGVMITRASAFFVARDVVATSYHALRGGHSGYAHTIDRRYNFPVAGAVAVDPQSDLALLKLGAADGRPLRIAASDAFELGDEIFVFGSPKGLDGSVTTGIVSGAALRTIANLELIQISAPISPGSSGGPVVNVGGEVIGVATLTVDGGRNLNFAIPASRLRRLVTKIGAEVVPISSAGPRGGPAGADAASDVAQEPECCGDSAFTLPSGRGAGFYVRVGERLFDERRYAEAKEAYKRAIDLDPRDAWAHFALAHVYRRLGCEKRAVIASRQAIILKPKESKYRDGLGWILLDFGRYREAADVYEEALRVDPKQALARTRLGICYVSLGRVADATAAFREAVRLDAKCALARFWLGKVCAEELGDRACALEQYRALQTEDAALADEMGEILRRTGR